MLFLIDLYEGVEIVAVAETKKEIRKAYNDRMDDTDCECDLMIFDTNYEPERKVLVDWGLI